MSDLAVIVPTKGRSHLMGRLLSSLWNLAEDWVHVYLVVCQKEIETYREALRHLGYREDADLVILTAPNDATYPSKINLAAAAVSSYRYLAVLNDEHEAATLGWDTKLKGAIGDEPFGLAYGPDGVWEEGQVPSAPLLTSSMFHALGWVAHPDFHHILVDNIWMDLARWCGTLHFLPEVRIQHHHHTLGAKVDSTYRETNFNTANQQADAVRYDAWIAHDRWLDGAKLAALWGDRPLPPQQFAPWEDPSNPAIQRGTA